MKNFFGFLLIWIFIFLDLDIADEVSKHLHSFRFKEILNLPLFQIWNINYVLNIVWNLIMRLIFVRHYWISSNSLILLFSFINEHVGIWIDRNLLFDHCSIFKLMINWNLPPKGFIWNFFWIKNRNILIVELIPFWISILD